MPYLYHDFVSAKSDSADSGLVRPTQWNARLEYGTTAATGPSGNDAFVREVLVANRTYYVRTNGSDNNTGLIDSSAGALATPAAAMTLVGALDFNGFAVTVQLSSGTFSLSGDPVVSVPVTVGQSETEDFIIVGSTATPANFIFTPSGGALEGFAVFGRCLIKGLTMQSGGGTLYRAISVQPGGIARYRNNVFGAVQDTHVYVVSQSLAQLTADYPVSGGGTYHFFNNGGAIENDCQPGTVVTVTSTPAFSGDFCHVAQSGGHTRMSSVYVSFSGTATGQRYNADINGSIDTGSASTTFFPGDVTGATFRGGVYA